MDLEYSCYGLKPVDPLFFTESGADVFWKLMDLSFWDAFSTKAVLFLTTATARQAEEEKRLLTTATLYYDVHLCRDTHRHSICMWKMMFIVDATAGRCQFEEKKR